MGWGGGGGGGRYNAELGTLTGLRRTNVWVFFNSMSDLTPMNFFPFFASRRKLYFSQDFLKVARSLLIELTWRSLVRPLTIVLRASKQGARSRSLSSTCKQV